MPLDGESIRMKMSQLGGVWELVEDRMLRAEFERGSFQDAMLFVQNVGNAAEEADHHPDIRIRYNKVTIELTTHSAGGLTDHDFALARKIETLA